MMCFFSQHSDRKGYRNTVTHLALSGMKRSQAPSVVAGCKRKKFIPPFVSSKSTSCHESTYKDVKKSSAPPPVVTSMAEPPCAGMVQDLQSFSASLDDPFTVSRPDDCQAETSTTSLCPLAFSSLSSSSSSTSSSSFISPSLATSSSTSSASSSASTSSSSAASSTTTSSSITSSFVASSSSSYTSAAIGECNRLSTKSVDTFRAPKQTVPCFRVPVIHQRKEVVIPSVLQDKFQDVENKEPNSSYYQVMWCKHSKKKHKKWEGDAILTTKGSTATLMDTEGKQIGRSTGYKLSELASLIEGSTLVIGGKQIEVMEHVSVEDWKSGKCFSGAVAPCRTATAGALSVNTAVLKKPFSVPSLEGGRGGRRQAVQQSTPAVISSLHDPTLPGSLVMPRPTAAHQLEHNPSGVPVVDVVVDPYLSFHLRPHQRQGVVFLYECVMGMRDYGGTGTILADEMGLGKTLQCITLLWTILKQGPYGRKPVARRAIVITPGSLVQNWEKEFSKWLGSERLLVYAVTTDKRVEEFPKSSMYPVIVISYEMFVRTYDILSQFRFDILVCDEGHRLKNNSTKTTSLIMSLPTLRRVILTGTPIQNDLQEFYSIVEFCNPGMLGSRAAFHRVYEQPIVQGKEPSATPDEREIASMRADELNRLISAFFLRRTQEVINQYLPPKVENVVFCAASPLQTALYTHLVRAQLARLRSRHHMELSQHLVCIGALKKVCNSPSLVYSAETPTDTAREENSIYSDIASVFPHGYSQSELHVGDSGKLAVLSAMLNCLFSDTNEKIVIVSNYTQTLDVLEKVCQVQGYPLLRLDGSTPSSKRFALVEQFNSNHSPQMAFLLSSKAGGVGLNLIGASRLVLYDIDWNPANDLQAMARVWRDGQRRRVHIYRLLTAGSIEEKIYQRQICKSGLAEIMESGGSSQATVKFSREELKDLFRLRTDTLCDTHDLLECNCTHINQLSRNSRSSRGAAEDIKKKIAMGELLKWSHFHQPVEECGLMDDLLLQASEKITFVFQSETNSTAANSGI